MLKLNLGCGTDYQEGYINVDMFSDSKVDAKFDICQIPYEDNTVDEIKAFHVIEHFDFHEGMAALKEWNRVLKPGGRLYLETPDFMASCKDFVNADVSYQNHLYGHFFAMPWIPGQTHKFLFTEYQLGVELGWCGFERIKRLPAASGYLDHYPAHIFLTVEAFKK